MDHLVLFLEKLLHQTTSENFEYRFLDYELYFKMVIFDLNARTHRDTKT